MISIYNFNFISLALGIADCDICAIRFHGTSISVVLLKFSLFLFASGIYYLFKIIYCSILSTIPKKVNISVKQLFVASNNILVGVVNNTVIIEVNLRIVDVFRNHLLFPFFK